MGIWFSCPGSDYFDECLDGEIESAATEAPAPATVRRSISFKTLTGEDVDTIIRTISFGRSGRRIGDCTKLKSLGSGEIIIQGSLSFKSSTKTDDEFHLQTTLQKQDLLRTATTTTKETVDMQDSVPAEDDPKHEAAAVKLQKVYKSFRTRRQLADCAVLVEQSWWKLLDFALLKHSSYFDAEKPESVGSRWSRARTKAAKVGKGLSKNTKAQKLALQHWLEAIDPRHRYGHNLHLYYARWLHCESKQPFFYWLDIGEGKEENIDKCPRLKLQQQCIKYLGPKERETYQVIVEDGRLIYKQNQQLVDTYADNKDSKWIFVLSASKILYAAKKKKGKFQHSSFLAGGATSSAGRLVVKQGILKAVWPHSGHYRPTEENFQEFLSFLKENNVDLTDVKISPIDEDIEGMPSQSTRTTSFTITEPLRDATSDYSFHKRNLFEELVEVRDEKKDTEEEEEEDGNNKNEEPVVSRELILKRINSKKGTKSLQLGKQLSIKWTTGAGPRISCVRDFPSELQFRALEQVNLSPRSERNYRSGTPRFSSTLHGD